MCGVAAVAGASVDADALDAMLDTQRHRGPDDRGTFRDGDVALGHLRLSIIDLSAAGRGPMSNHDGSITVSFNGEIYNYLELREELSAYPYRTRTDTEVLIAAYERWGEACLDRLLGMFAFVLWDARRQVLLAVRDRFGVKPLLYHQRPDGTVLFASEVRALLAAGAPSDADEVAWATYLAYGLSDHGARTFHASIAQVPPGSFVRRYPDGRLETVRWYDLAQRAGDQLDARPDAAVVDEARALFTDAVRLRFRSDVPVGINLSGGLDSSLLLGLVHQTQGEDSDVSAFTFVTGDDAYDELPWVTQMLERTKHPSVVCGLSASEVPALAEDVMRAQGAPYGGLPTLAYARVFEQARARGVIVLLDGQGVDEQWAGYDYYAHPDAGSVVRGPVQASASPSLRPDLLDPEFAALAERPVPPTTYPDALRRRRLEDATVSKIPRALRFNDRISMRASTELREPFLDHRLFELALRQPPDRLIRGGVHKWLPRQIAAALLPDGVVEAPKRPVQTPQREWLRSSLAPWASEHIDAALSSRGAWFDVYALRVAWETYVGGAGDNSYPAWQWLSLGLWEHAARA